MLSKQHRNGTLEIHPSLVWVTFGNLLMLSAAIEMFHLPIAAKVATASHLETRCNPRTPAFLDLPETHLRYGLENPEDGLQILIQANHAQIISVSSVAPSAATASRVNMIGHDTKSRCI
jgi:hypothetical protein